VNEAAILTVQFLVYFGAFFALNHASRILASLIGERKRVETALAQAGESEARWHELRSETDKMLAHNRAMIDEMLGVLCAAIKALPEPLRTEAARGYIPALRRFEMPGENAQEIMRIATGAGKEQAPN
jgi:hypothetical protein